MKSGLGLLALLLTVFLVGFMMVTVMGKTRQAQEEREGVGGIFDSIDEAEHARDLIEQRSTNLDIDL